MNADFELAARRVILSPRFDELRLFGAITSAKIPYCPGLISEPALPNRAARKLHAPFG